MVTAQQLTRPIDGLPDTGIEYINADKSAIRCNTLPFNRDRINGHIPARTGGQINRRKRSARIAAPN